MSFRAALRDDALWDGEMSGVEIGGIAVLLVRVDGAVHAYRDACAHKGMPLSRGSLSRGVLTCSVHHWQYDAATGCGINPAGARLCRLPVRILNGQVEVDVGEVGARAAAVSAVALCESRARDRACPREASPSGTSEPK